MHTHGQPQTPQSTHLGAKREFIDFGERTEDRHLPKLRNWQPIQPNLIYQDSKFAIFKFVKNFGVLALTLIETLIFPLEARHPMIHVQMFTMEQGLLVNQKLSSSFWGSLVGEFLYTTSFVKKCQMIELIYLLHQITTLILLIPKRKDSPLRIL